MSKRFANPPMMGIIAYSVKVCTLFYIQRHLITRLGGSFPSRGSPKNQAYPLEKTNIINSVRLLANAASIIPYSFSSPPHIPAG